MVAPRKEGLGKNERDEGLDRQDRPLGGESSEESGEIEGSESSGRRRTSDGLTERLRDVLRDGGDGDLLLDRGDVENGGVVRWLRALDQQVLGACRADERLKPLLKLNISSGVEEDRLIAQLSQHFEASEVGMLARCLCIPLVSIRVGKVNKQGNLLCPTAIRGNLNLTLLPSSNMRIAFAGDDGHTEKLALLSNDFDSQEVDIEEISADSSGRTFLVKLPRSHVLYFWCSEKSKLHGMELLAKMKDILARRPSLSHLTGISESRLDSFATHLRAYLLGSSNISEVTASASSSGSLGTASSLHASDSDCRSPSMVSKSSRLRLTSHMAKGHPFYQGSLSPRSNTFKDGFPRSSSSMRSVAREKLRRRGDNGQSSLVSNIQPSTSVPTMGTQISRQCESVNTGDSRTCGLLPFCLPEMPCLVSSLSTSSSLPLNLPPAQVSVSTSLFSPYYCWCPPCPSSLQYTVTPSHLPITFDESLPLPPLSSLLSATGPPVSLVTSKLPVDASEFPTLKLPSLYPEPLVRLPLPVSSLVTLPSSQQIPTFTPFMSDPIVHVPVIDVCSSGQGYLVSAGPAISSAIPPLLPSLVRHPLIPGTESVVEKSARETLRMLMASTPTSATPELMNVLPAVLKGMDENFPFALLKEGRHGTSAAGSQGLYCGSLDVEAVARGVSFMQFSPVRQKVVDGGTVRGGNLEGDSPGGTEELLKNHAVSDGYGSAGNSSSVD